MGGSDVDLWCAVASTPARAGLSFLCPAGRAAGISTSTDKFNRLAFPRPSRLYGSQCPRTPFISPAMSGRWLRAAASYSGMRPSMGEAQRPQDRTPAIPASSYLVDGSAGLETWGEGAMPPLPAPLC